MRPGARLQASIELLDLIIDPPEGQEHRPAERVVAGYMRGRRYIGSKDRRAIYDIVYGVLRARARLDWALGAAATSRLRVAAWHVLTGALSVDDVAGLFDGTGYAPEPFVANERSALAALQGHALDDPAQPDWVRAELPEWLFPLVPDAPRYMHALPQKVGLRVNRLKASVEEARRALAAEAIAAEPGRFMPDALIVPRGTAILSSAAYRNGLVEVQDEGSQLVAALVGAKPGMAVLDYCAGAGGKALALAAAMGNRGRLVAADVDAARMADLPSRAARAGASLIETVVIEELPPLEWRDAFDRVLVDAPCSGSGRWPRHPEAPWRLSPANLAAFTESQGAILDHAAGCVRPGGWLIYASCSVLQAENENVVRGFLAEHAEFSQAASVEADLVPAGFFREGNISLMPDPDGTDGFFCSIIKRNEI